MLVEVKPRTRKPAFGSVEVDWAHPLARNLIGCWLFNEGGKILNLARPYRTQGVLGSGDKWGASAQGSAVRFDGSSSANCKIVLGSYGSDFGSTSPVSVYAWAIPSVSGGNHAIFDQTGAGDATNSGFQLFVQTNFDWRLPGATDVVYSGSVDAGKLYKVCGTNTGAVAVGAQNLYVNGVVTVGSGTAVAYDNTGNLLIGALGSSVYPWAGDIILVYLYRRALAAREVAQLDAEPYAFLKPKLATFFSLPGSTGGAVTPPVLAGGWFRHRV